jgi:uncharacterized protein
MMPAEDPLAIAATEAIRAGDAAELEQLLRQHPELATIWLGDRQKRSGRTLLHVVTDWPGHVPQAAAKIRALVAAGADVNARFAGPHTETPLHWAASSDDIAVLDALLDADADIDATGAVIGGGTPLDDARAFLQRNAARRLIERGATVGLDDAATLGLLDHLHTFLAADPPPQPADITRAFWGACHGGQQQAAQILLAHGADPNWIPDWEPRTPLDAARRSGADDLVAWLLDHGATPASQQRR